MTIITLGSAACSTMTTRPPRQGGMQELHGSEVAKAMLASSHALDAPMLALEARAVTTNVDTAMLDGWLVEEEERVDSPRERPRFIPYLDAFVVTFDSDEAESIEIDLLPTFDAKITTSEVAGAKETKAKVDTDKEKRREAEADRAKSELERRAPTAKAAAKPQEPKPPAAGGGDGTAPMARATERRAPPRPSCTCQPGDPLCACL